MSLPRDPRSFCREPGYEATLFLTYSFDPLFFEASVLPELAGDRTVVVVADARELEAALPRCVRQCADLGRRYVLVPAALPGAFHPKMILRAGAGGTAAWIGSGNLTQGGWGSNAEIASCWPLAAGDAGWLSDLLRRLGDDCAPAPLLRDRLPLFQRLGAAPAGGMPPVLFGTPVLPLAEQLAGRWRGRRFDEVRICTGSTDEAGDFLAWARETFGVRRAIVHLDPRRSSFDAGELRGTGVEVRIAAAPVTLGLHAKCYWFSGADGQAAVSGSANCSAAAWRRLAGGRGLNAELVVVYDETGPEAMDGVFHRLLSHEEADPAAVLIPRAGPRPARPAPPPLAIAEAEALGGTLRLRFANPLPEEAEIIVELQADGARHDIALTRGAGEDWSGLLPERTGAADGALFVRAVASIAGDLLVSPLRWVDDIARILRAENRRIIGPAASDLGRTGLSRRERNRVLEAVRTAAALLLGQRAEFRDADRPAPRAPRPAGAEAPAVGPGDLLRRVEEARRTRTARSLHPTNAGGSLDGVLGILLDAPGGGPAPDALEANGDGFARPTRPSRTGAPPPADARARTPGRPEREQFEAVVGEVLDGIRAPAFRDGCTASRMVAACAFPLAIAIAGARGGWSPAGRVATVAESVLDALLRHPWPDAPDRPGLLAHVRARYAEGDPGADVFDHAVGDGTLWFLLLAALARAPVHPGNRRSLLRKAKLVRDLVAQNILYGDASADHLAALAVGLDISAVEEAVVRDGAAIAAALDRLETLLAARLPARRGGAPRSYPPRSCVFSPAGWHLLEPQDGSLRIAGAVELSRQMTLCPGIHAAMDDLAALLAAERLEDA